jgi:putative addiction module component (TIGR02574 family)
MGTNDITDLLKLAVSERLAIAEELWASVATEHERAPVSEAEEKFVNTRLNEYLANPSDVVSWSEVKKGLGL